MLKKLLKLINAPNGFFLVTTSTIVNSSIGGAFFLYIAIILTVDDYGKVNYLLSYAALAFALSGLGMDTIIMTYLPKRSIHVLYQSNSVVLIASILSSILVGFVVNNLIVGFLVLATACYFMSTVQLMSQKRYKENAILSIAGKALQVILSIVLYSFYGINGFILGYALAYSIFGYRFIVSLKNFSFKFDELKNLSRISLKIYIATLTSILNFATTLVPYLDKVIVGIFFGYYTLGSYQLSYQVFLFLSIMPSNIFRVLLTHEAEGSVIGNRLKLSIVAFACIISFSTIILTPYALPIAYPKYPQSVLPIQIMSLGIIPLSLVYIIQAKILAEKRKTNHFLYAGLIMTLSEILLLFVLGSLFTLVGIAMSLVIALTIQFLYLAAATRGKI